MIPRLRPHLGIAEFAAATKGGRVDDFERRFAALMEQDHAIAFPYGRTGLLLLLEALGLKDAKIVCPAYSCVVVAHAIVLSGNRPVFVDSEALGFNMDLDMAEEEVRSGAAAIIATSIHGYPVDLDRLDRLRERSPDLIVIQDCAHSFAAEWRGRPVQKAGHAALFGLNVSKLITSIFGGVVTTDDAKLANRIVSLRNRRLEPASCKKSWQRSAYIFAAATALHPWMFGAVHRIMSLGLIDRFTEYYNENEIDMPVDHLSAMSAAEAGVGIVQCGRYRDIVDHRRSIAACYDNALKSAPGIRRPPILDGATYSHYVACVDDPAALIRQAASDGVELGRLIDYCIPDMPAYRRFVSRNSAFPRARKLNAEVINLPLHVDTKTADRIADSLCKHMA